jgi:Mce-associated membrane protein
LTALGRILSRLARRANRVPPRLRRITVVALAVLVLAAGAATTTLDIAARQASALDQARFDAVAQARLRVAQLLTYSAATITTDIDRARQDTAGAFAQYYAPFAQQTIAPAVQQAGTSSVAAVTRAAAVSVTADTVVVIVFIDQKTSSRAQPQARSTSSTAQVTMTDVAGQWLISALTPTSNSPETQ